MGIFEPYKSPNQKGESSYRQYRLKADLPCVHNI